MSKTSEDIEREARESFWTLKRAVWRAPDVRDLGLTGMCESAERAILALADSHARLRLLVARPWEDPDAHDDGSWPYCGLCLSYGHLDESCPDAAGPDDSREPWRPPPTVTEVILGRRLVDDD